MKSELLYDKLCFLILVRRIYKEPCIKWIMDFLLNTGIFLPILIIGTKKNINLHKSKKSKII